MIAAEILNSTGQEIKKIIELHYKEEIGKDTMDSKDMVAEILNFDYETITDEVLHIIDIYNREKMKGRKMVT